MRGAIGCLAAHADWTAAKAVTGSAVPAHMALDGLTPLAAIEAAETYLGCGIPVVIDAASTPPFLKVLGASDLVLSPASESRVSALLRRVRDVVIAAVGIAVLAPLMCGLALLVKWSSPGPVLFATQVVGRDGRPFTWRKFRSMREARPEEEAQRRERFRAFVQRASDSTGGSGRSTKVVDESRITPVGRILRRHSLDELPQLWNVLVGDMTLVGPRPCLPYEYELQTPAQRARFRATPGLTGPWQAYARSRVSFDEMVLLDYCYGRLRSSRLDLQIIVRTISVVLSGEGGK
jgi:lipopolysaccharide/colanic/teichoic acid biosynthesis glycosyltransferase